MIISVRNSARLLAASCLAAVLPLFLSAQDWPMVGGNPMRTGWAGNNVGITPPLVAGAQVLVPEYGCEHFTMVGGVLYAAAGGTPNVLNAVDISSGAVLWSFPVPGSRLSNGKVPAVGAGIVIFGGQGSDSIFALSPTTGALLWAKRVGPSYSRNAIIDNGRVYIVADSTYCIEAASGGTIWTNLFTAATSPAADADNVYICGGTVLYALNKSTGAERWRARVIAQSYGSVTVSGDLVFAAGRDTVYAVRKSDGVIAWRAPLLGMASELSAGAIAVSDDAVCVAFWNDPLNRGGVACFERSDGRPRWRHTVPTPGAMTPTIVDGVAYFVSWTDKLLIGIDMTHGGIVFQGTGVSAEHQPVVADRALWVSTLYGVIPFRSGGSGLRDASNVIPRDARLFAFPNPSGSDFTIRLDSPTEMHAIVEVTDLLGRRVAALADGKFHAGSNDLIWNPAHSGHPSGLYMLVLRTARESRAMRLMYAR